MRWERDLLAFLRRELAPSPGRWRATLRTTVVVALAITAIMALHVPNGEFVLVTLFVLTPADAGASLEKARLRAFGTIGGGMLGLLGVVLTTGKPWLFVPYQAVVFFVAMFLARTTTAPYAFVLGAVTFAMVLPLFPTTPAANVETALWRTALTTLGALLATGAQLVLWPDDPEVLLIDDLAGRIRDTETVLASLRALRPGERVPAVEEGIAVTGVTRQLDLLKNAETRSRWLRQRHTEQIALIASVQWLVTAARRLARLASLRPLPAWMGPRLDRVLAGCTEAHAALTARRPVDLPVAESPAATVSDPDLEAAAAVDELDRALANLAVASRFLVQGSTTTASAPDPVREPVAAQAILTPASSIHNVEAMRFALKVALAASICGVFMEATHLPGLTTSLITCAVIAQSFVGAGLRKALLRVAGAIAGGLIALVVTLVLIPSMETLASYLVVSTAAFAAAAWVVAGSSRIGYVGLQMAIVMALTLVETHAPSIDLAAPANRLLGVLLGILVMGGLDIALWPVFGETALRRTLAEALRQMAALHRVWASSTDRAARRQQALGVYRTLGEALAMHDDLAFEPGRGDAPPTHAPLLRVVSDLERLFLDLLALERHRPAAVSPEAAPVLSRVDTDITGALEALARRLGHEADGTPGASIRLEGLPAIDELREFARLYDVVRDALHRLTDDLDVLERAATAPVRTGPATRPSPPRPRPRTPVPQPS